ncbi:hypothetical protein L6452_43253 [Arctium lappa]|uniref:Uncharacterized protein n=1 Tax=Arctium lappa TaxID=4217 RepID=A0ACB8XPM2_ARCLA|nr:hypothetical protein L6452_43253 [Arctium lappa]
MKVKCMSNVIGFSLETDSSKEIENRRWSCSEAAVNDVVDAPTQTRKRLDMDTLVVIGVTDMSLGRWNHRDDEDWVVDLETLTKGIGKEKGQIWKMT